MTSSEVKTVRLVLSCVVADECSVIFEPFGAEHVLRANDDFHVEITGPGSGEVMVWYAPGAISVTPWLGGDYSNVVTSSGQTLAT
jgi:hypothetical protein